MNRLANSPATALERLMIFAGNGTPRLAQDVAKHLNLSLGRAIVGKFSDGEVMIEIMENVRGKDIFVLQSTCAPTNDNLMELLVMVDALKRSSAARASAASASNCGCRADSSSTASSPASSSCSQ